MIFPLFTRNFYVDKDRQETLIAASDTDWTIVRPAPFARSAPVAPLEVHAEVQRNTVLRRITRDEVVRFVLDVVDGGHHRQRLFVGHP